MELELKQRLVGAAVITALAAIFVPMLFDDPIDDSGKMISELTLPDQPIASFDSREQLPTNIDDVIQLPATSANKSIKKDKSNLLSGTSMERWFVQVGNFGQVDNAISLQKKVRRQGFPVTIAKVSSDSGLLYKVRIGPELDRKRAEKMKDKFYKLNKIKGMVISDNK